MASQGCPNSLFKAECQTTLCLNNWAFDATHPDFQDSQQLDLLCKAPGFGGAYEACGLCSKVYDYSACCTDSNPYSCLASYAKKQPDCQSDLGFISTLSNMLGPHTATTTATGSDATASPTMTSDSAMLSSTLSSGSGSIASTTGSVVSSTDSAMLSSSAAASSSAAVSSQTMAAVSSASASAAASSSSPGAAASNHAQGSFAGAILLLTYVLRFL